MKDKEKYIIFYNKGVSFDNIGKYNDAINYYDKAIEINPKMQSIGNIKVIFYFIYTDMKKH